MFKQLTFVPPRTPVEEILANIWTKILNVEPIGIHDNFFELGGDSLNATQVVSRIRKALGVELSLDDLFEYPTVATFAENLEPKLHSQPNQKTPAIRRASREGNRLLSFAQQRLWFLEQFQPNTALYNIARALKLNGLLNYEALKKALAEIVARHESLRTTFVTQDETPVQVISEDKSVELPIIDLSQLPLPEQLASVEQLSQQQAVCPFDLSRDLMLRATLLRLSSTEHILVLVMHHIASDGWSMGIFFQELAALYNGYVTGLACSLPELPIQYADFAYWQREWLQGKELETQLAYWKQQLEGIPALLELPTDRVRPAIQSFKGAKHSCVLPAPLTCALKTLSQREGVTLFMTLLAAFKTLLYRLSGQSDIVVGSPIAGRHQIETEGLIGFFVNTLLLRTHVQDDATFRDLLTQVRSVSLGAYAHQDLPFEKLVEELQPERSRSQTPLFQVMFVLQNASSSDCQLSGLSVNSLNLDSGTAKFDLTLSMKETELGLIGTWKYNTDLFDAATIERMAGHFQTLLEAIVADAGQRVDALPLLSKSEQQQLLVEWNSTLVDYPSDSCLHQHFEAQVERTPNAVAVVFENQQLTYRELNNQANQLAHYLQQLGVRPEVLVGICTERSLEMVIGLLAILKAGGAYVPLDPMYPPERLTFMLENADIFVLLTQKRLAEGLLEYKGDVICLDADSEAIAQQSQENQVSGVTPENLIYAIYTSGSTGKPKGAGVYQRSFTNLLNWFVREFDFTCNDRVLLISSLSFDLTQKNIYAPLMVGGELHLLSSGCYDAAQIVESVCDKQVTWLNCTPSAFYPLIDLGDKSLCMKKTLRYVFLGGEPISISRLKVWLDSVPCKTQIVNTYGPTECTDICAAYRVAKPEQWLEKVVPIGKPIYNAKVYVLDQNLKPLPVGVVGELYVGGEGVGRGYLNLQELTASKFIPNPYPSPDTDATRTGTPWANSDKPGSRLYKTGDLARYRPDGNIEFLGRIDHQVKLRGFRIELGEIEAVLTQHPAVQQAVAIVREDLPGDKRLVAYIVTKPQQAPTTDELRHFLKQKLPDYMIPSAWVELDDLPLTPNGKIDRRALRAPSPTRTTAETFVPPRTPLEEILANIWTKILNVEPIGIHDNFFELGGHSIQAMILINKLQEKMRQILYIVAIFDAPTVAKFADYLNREYPQAVRELLGSQVSPEIKNSQKINVAKIARMQLLLKQEYLCYQSSAKTTDSTNKNQPAIFILSPPRSGSTLLRVILGAHPQLFAPPEMYLLPYKTLIERKAILSGRKSYQLEGVIRTVMQIKGCNAEEAQHLIQDLEEKKLTVKQFYGLLQQWIPGKTLVDKTPGYTYDLEILKHAEVCFENPIYIHLLRHPYDTISSIEEARVDLLLEGENSLTSREKAELLWLICHQNILEFLKHIPKSRQHQLKFENLVKFPQNTVAGICQFLGVEFHSEMLQPYKNKKQRMTDGLHSVSRMVGDPKFHTHKEIDARSADRWKQDYTVDFLSEETWQIAESLGYERISLMKDDRQEEEF